jgi:hypothetical protein
MPYNTDLPSLQRIKVPDLEDGVEAYMLTTNFVREGTCFLYVNREERSVRVTSIGMDGKVNHADIDKIFAAFDGHGEATLEQDSVDFTNVDPEAIVSMLTRTPLPQDVPDSDVGASVGMSFTFDPEEPAPAGDSGEGADPLDGGDAGGDSGVPGVGPGEEPPPGVPGGDEEDEQDDEEEEQ